MKVQIWSDFVCPYCYAGTKQLMMAIEESDPSIEMEVMSYELAPGVEDDNTMLMADVLEEKFGMSEEDRIANSKQVETMIKKAGLEINSEDLKFSNTLKAQTLLQYFKEQGQGNDFATAVFNAYFVEGAYLNKTEKLIELAAVFGLNETKTREIIASEKYIQKVHEDQKLGKKVNVTSVPHVVMNNKLYVSGAQDKDIYIAAIKEAKE